MNKQEQPKTMMQKAKDETTKEAMKYLRDLQDAGYSKSLVGQWIGVNYTAIYRWHNGIATPAPDNYRNLVRLWKNRTTYISLNPFPMKSPNNYVQERTLNEPSLNKSKVSPGSNKKGTYKIGFSLTQSQINFTCIASAIIFASLFLASILI